MSKYLIKRQDDQLRISLTLLGAVREALGGLLIALPWAALGTAAIFIPEIYKTLRGEDLGQFSWRYLLAICLICAVGYGLRRASRVAFWAFDARRRRVQMQTRSIFGGQGELFEAQFSDVERVVRERRALVIQIRDAPVLKIASAWLGAKELNHLEHEINAALKLG